MKPTSLRNLVVILVLSAITLFATACDQPQFLHFQTPQSLPAYYRQPNHMQELITNKVDILWVIDNSGSMYSYWDSTIANADLFISQFASRPNIDWNMGMVSTDLNNAPFLGFTVDTQLNSTTPDAVEIFQDAVRRLGDAGVSGTEATFGPVMNAVRDFPAFIRPRSELILIIVTDAPEQSRSITAQAFLNFLKSKVGSLDRVTTHAVIGPQDFGCQQTDDFWHYQASPYEELVLATQGKTYQLCGPDYGGSLAAIGQSVVRRSYPRIYLNARPRAETLKVSHAGLPVPGGTSFEGGYWTYDLDLNALVFHDLSFAQEGVEFVDVEFQEDNGEVLR